jgi:hypothetical protein
MCVLVRISILAVCPSDACCLLLPQNTEHAPWAFRANGVVSQNADFAAVFRCPVGSAMSPLNRCVMWRSSDGDGVLSLESRLERM